MDRQQRLKEIRQIHETDVKFNGGRSALYVHQVGTLFEEIDRLNAELAKHQPQLVTGLPKLKPIQAKIFVFIMQHVEFYGYPPSVREIATGVDLLSVSTVHRHLTNLEKLGYINRGTPGAPRTLRIIGKREEANT